MPSVSEKQHRAMEAAAHGHSTLGIPENVGKEFVAADETLAESMDAIARRMALRSISSSLKSISGRLSAMEMEQELARFDAEWDVRADGMRADDANWKESDHPRTEDGKFTSGAGSSGVKHSPEVKAAFNEYMASVKPGTKPKPAGLMKHMLMKGGFTANEIFQSAKQAFNLDDKAAIYPNIYHSQMTKAGLNPPEIQGKWGKPKTAKAEEAKVEEIAAPPAEAKIEVKKSEKVGAPVLDTKGWVKVSDKLGSNPGGKYKDAEGKEWYGKQSKSPDHAKNEVLASKLYELAGAPVIKSQFADFNGKLGTAALWHDGVIGVDPHSAITQAKAAENFAVHAWLANWDAAGLTHDNQADVDGVLTTMDVGGSLLYRAQGQPKGKAFGDTATEWETLRNSEINQQNAELFGNMTEEQLKESAKRVAVIPDKAIWELVHEFGPGYADDKMALATKLMARRDDIAKKAGLDTSSPAPSIAVSNTIKNPFQLLSEETHKKFGKFIDAKYAVDNNNVDEAKAQVAQDKVDHILTDFGLEEAYDKIGSFNTAVSGNLNIDSAFDEYLFSVYSDLKKAIGEKGKNAEFEKSHDRNPDGTFKKKFGADEDELANFKLHDPEPVKSSVTPAPKVKQKTIKTAQLFEKFSSPTMKKLAQELLTAPSEFNYVIEDGMEEIQQAMEDAGTDYKALHNIISTFTPIDDNGDGDPGVAAYNSLLAQYQEELKIHAPKAETKLEKPSYKLPKEVLSKQSLAAYDTLLNKLLSDPDTETVKKVDDFASAITDLALDGKWQEVYNTLGPLSAHSITGVKDHDLNETVDNYAYQLYTAAGKKLGIDTIEEHDFPGDEEAPKPPQKTPTQPKHKVKQTTHDFHEQLKSYWPSTLPANLEAVQAKDTEIEEALSKPTEEDQHEALKAIEPIENPSGQAKKALNSYLEKVKKDYGISTNGAGKTEASATPPAQVVAAAKIKTFPATTINHTYELEDASGKEVTSTLKASSKNVPGDFYSKVTAAYGGDHSQGMSKAVDKAMEEYFSHMWEKFDQNEQNSLAAYKNGTYKAINAALLSDPEKAPAHIKEHIDMMSKAIKKSFVPATTPAFRGLDCTLQDLTGFSDPEDAVGRCFMHKNFASISRSESTSKGFGARTMMKMTIPAGTPGILLRGQDHGEREIVLDRFSMFRIDKVVKDEYYVGSHTLHVTYIGRRDDGGEGK